MREEGIVADPRCARCAAPLVDTRASVIRDGGTYCCGNCAAAGVNTEPLQEA